VLLRSVALVGVIVCANLVAFNSGPIGASIAVSGALLLWWISHVYAERQMDRMFSNLMAMDLERRERALAELEPAIRKRMTQRLRSAEGPRPKPESNTGNARPEQSKE